MAFPPVETNLMYVSKVSSTIELTIFAKFRYIVRFDYEQVVIPKVSDCMKNRITAAWKKSTGV